MSQPLTVGIVGGGWAGLAAAVEATLRGHHVTLFEMASQLGGRARAVESNGMTLDNGQHILIGAYRETLALMRTVGVDIDRAFARSPLRMVYSDGSGLRLEPGSPTWAFARAVLKVSGWSWHDRFTLLRIAAGWGLSGFQCDPDMTVSRLGQSLSKVVRDELLDPLCVAALNTPSCDASASVFLRVLRDALLSGPGSSDLLIPRASLSDVLPQPAARWLELRGVRIERSCRINLLNARGKQWMVDGSAFDKIILATTPIEAARLASLVQPAWASGCAALQYEPIITVYLKSPGTRLPEPMLALRAGVDKPAQFVFDRGQTGGPEGLLAFVISGAQQWVDAGREATLEATLRQARDALGVYLVAPLTPVQLLTEKRATFRCTPNLRRVPAMVTPGLMAAGDYVEGPFPATLEGAVRSGVHAARDGI